MTNISEFVDEYNNLLDKLVNQARNDLMQFNEVKENDLNEPIKNFSFSNATKKIIEMIDDTATDIFNNFLYARNESECNCGKIHTHNGYKKFSAELREKQLEIKMHYLLEPFTRRKMSWDIFSRTPNDNIFYWIIIRIPLDLGLTIT